MPPTHRPRKRFGQHFLTDSHVIVRILDAIRPSEQDHIVEIGPGQGALTDALANRARRLTLVELDRDLVGRLQQRYAQHEHVDIISADALTVDFTAFGDRLRIVGNLPYNISTPLLFHLRQSAHHVSDMHFMLQKEVVDRIAATPGSKHYGRLSVMLQCCFDTTSLFDVGPDAFNPPPKVNSSIIRLSPLAIVDPATQTQAFADLVLQAFSQRRKTIRNSLRQQLSVAQISAAQVDPGARPETLSVADFARLCACAIANSE